jgi:NifU-like protein
MVYPPKVWQKISSAPTGNAVEGEALGRAASFRCGCFVEFAVGVDGGVTDTTFRTNGCGYMIASAAVLTESVKGRKLGELHGLDDDELIQTVEAELGPLPPGRRQCADVCIEALHAAFREYRAQQIEEFRGEKALICTCFGVTEETIEGFISAKQPRTVDDVTAACRAGGGCGSCRMLIQEMLDGSSAYDISVE